MSTGQVYLQQQKTSAQQSSFQGGPLIHKPSHQFGVFGNPFPWKHLPIQCCRHDTSHSSRTSPPIQPLTRSECFRSSLCGYPVPKTNCPWTPGVTMVGRWQQRRTERPERSLERNNMKSTAATHVEFPVYSSHIISGHTLAPFVYKSVDLYITIYIIYKSFDLDYEPISW